MKKLFFPFSITVLFIFCSFLAFVKADSFAVPGAPTNVSGVSGDGQVTVNFKTPQNNGGKPVEAYRVVSTPGSYKITGIDSPILVSGLKNGIAYTFVVTAINEICSSIPSVPSAGVTPSSKEIIPDVINDIVPLVIDDDTTNNDDTNSGNAGRGSHSSSGGGLSGEAVQNTVLADTVIAIVDTVKGGTDEAVKVTQNIVSNTNDYVNTPIGNKVTKTITTVGVVGSGAISITALSSASPIVMSEIFLIPLRLWGLLMTTFGLKKKNRPWGTVYDSVTKQPLDPAYVLLKDLSGKEIASCITDLDGRYGFLVEPGKYIIEAQKTNYSYPSVKLFGKTADEMYDNLYFGKELEIKEAGIVISNNIPLDPQRFDWNEFAKKEKKLMSFYSKRDKILNKVSDFLFEIGFVIAVLALLFAPEPYNYGIVILYVIILGFKMFGIKTKTFGKIINTRDESPLSFAIIHIFTDDWSLEIGKKVADKYGKYYSLLPIGKYNIKIDRKNDDESYTEVYKTAVPLDISNGVLNNNFLV